MSHRACMLGHAVRQLKDRFGVDATARDIEDLGYAVSAGYSRLIKTQEARGREVHEVTLRGQHYTVAYDVKTQTIVTFIPDNDRRWLKHITPRDRRQDV